MPMLHEILATKRDEVMRCWKASVQGTITPEAMHPMELIDHLPTFVGEIVSALRDDAGLPAPGPLPEASATAAEHGEQRLRLGFSLDQVVREYGALRNAIVATARDSGAQISFRELEVVADATITGIARAVTEYTQQRDAELLRHANEHFAFIAHEIRNPLSTAMTALAVMKQKGEIPSEGRAVRALERALRSTSELIDQTLKIARVSAGIELRRQPTTLKALFDEVEGAAVSDAEAKNIELRQVIESDATIEIDVRLMQSALGNLVRNAVKYSAPGGHVVVRGSIANGRTTIEVEDACGGLPPGKVEEAFAPFVRLDDKQSGFGLGLAIAKQAVDAHGGSIRVQNLPGKGCIFVLELPTP